MGLREATDMGRTHVVIADEVLKKVDEVAGGRGRSRYIEAATREKLERDEVLEALEATAGILKEEDYPEWRDSKTTAEWVRSIRGGDNSA